MRNGLDSLAGSIEARFAAPSERILEGSLRKIERITPHCSQYSIGGASGCLDCLQSRRLDECAPQRARAVPGTRRGHTNLQRTTCRMCVSTRRSLSMRIGVRLTPACTFVLHACTITCVRPSSFPPPWHTVLLIAIWPAVLDPRRLTLYPGGEVGPRRPRCYFTL